MNRCEDCESVGRSYILVQDPSRGEVVCQSCGLVVDDVMLDDGPGRYSENMDTVHHAPAKSITDPRGHTSSIISFRGTKMSDKNREQMRRLNRYQKTRGGAKERSKVQAFAEKDRIIAALGLSGTVDEQSSMLYHRAAEKNIIRGRSTSGVMAACVYCACRMSGVARTLDEIAEGSSVGRKEIARTFRFLRNELNIRLTPNKPEDYVHRFCSKLDFKNAKTTAAVASKALELLHKIREIEEELGNEDTMTIASGKLPSGVASAAIYIAALYHNDSKTQKQVADVAGITEVTIRNRYKMILETLNRKDSSYVQELGL